MQLFLMGNYMQVVLIQFEFLESVMKNEHSRL